ncbi:MAG: 2-phospho-L-lactate transferase CofD family protein [Sulfuricurvum sp.]
MKVVLFSGGSGSREIQKGLLKYPQIELDIIVNGYDNGKSTGATRQVFGGKILGPSDIRKNQFLQYELQYRNSNLTTHLDHRFTSSTPIPYIEEYFIDKMIPKFFTDIIKRYFEDPRSSTITYEDFSIGNIIYGQLAFENNNSMQKAADLIQAELKIKNRIMVNSDESLFLYGVCENGDILYDEADIVEHNNKNRIVDIGFFNNNIKQTHSTFNKATEESVESADIIIFSSGTQWSSLIPTYKGVSEDGETSFKDLISRSNAKKYLVMNSTEDADMLGVSGEEIQTIVNDYINMNEITTIIDSDAVESLNKSTLFNNLILPLSGDTNKHDGVKLITELLWDYYGNPSTNDLFIFDWDDTIHARSGKNKIESDSNIIKMNNIDSIVVSGNTHHGIKSSRVYADGGLNYYKDNVLQGIIDDSLSIKSYFISVKEIINSIGFNDSMIQNRANACISIKPVDPFYREAVTKLLNILLPDNLRAKKSGNTTIDIMNKDSDKIIAVKKIIKDSNKRCFYIGDEYNAGNDFRIFNEQKEINLYKFIKVNNVIDTSLFLELVRD